MGDINTMLSSDAIRVPDRKVEMNKLGETEYKSSLLPAIFLFEISPYMD